MQRRTQGWSGLILALALGGLRCGGEEATEDSMPVRSKGQGGGGGQEDTTTPFPKNPTPFPGGQGASGGGEQGGNEQGGASPAGAGGEAGEGGNAGEGGEAGAGGDAGAGGVAGDPGEGGAAGQGGSVGGCGDGKCAAGESCSSCPKDCGACPTETKVYPKSNDDCVCLKCPPDFPYVKSCNLGFSSTSTDPSSNSNCFEKRSSGTVYAMQGKNCGTSSDYQGKVTGYIVCAKSAAGASCSVSNAIACKSWPSASLKDSYNNCK